MRHLARQLILTALLLVPLTGASAQDEFTYLDSAQWTFNKDCVVRGDTLVAALTYGVQVWDIADPAAPALIGDYYSAARKTIKVDWLGDLIVLTTQDGHLQIVDAGDLSNLSHHATLTGFGTYADVLLQERGADTFAFVAGSTGLKCVDLSTPASPSLRGSLDPAGNHRALTASGDILYMLSTGSGVHTVDSNDVDNLQLLDSDAIAASTLLDIHTDGDVLAVAARDDGFWLYDLADPADPAFATQMTTVNRAKSVHVRDDTLYSALDIDGLRIHDVSNPASPVFLGEHAEDWLYFETLDIDGDRACLNYWDGANAGVQVFDLSNLAAPALLGHTPAHDYCRYVDAHGDFVYTATGHQGVYAHEIVENGGDVSLVLRGQMPVMNTWSLEAKSDTVYIASANEGFVIADFSDPDNPVEIGSLDLGICRAVTVAGDVAYVGVFGLGPASVDISDPANPVLIEQITVGYQSVGLELKGNLLASADRLDGVNLWDVSNPADIQWLGNSPTAPSKAEAVAFLPASNYLYVAAGAVRIIDTVDTGLPTEVASFGSGAQGLDFVSSHLLYVAQNGSGLFAYDVVAPTAPVQLDRYDTADNAFSVAALGDMAFVADYSAMIGFRFETSTAAPHAPLPGMLALSAQPNPFNPRTDLHFSLEEAGRVRVEIFEVTGRRLTLLDDGLYPAGNHSLRWNGQDDAGRGLPSGVYFARIAFDGVSTRALGTNKLVLIR